jgi:hypothetical protein
MPAKHQVESIGARFSHVVGMVVSRQRWTPALALLLLGSVTPLEAVAQRSVPVLWGIGIGGTKSGNFLGGSLAGSADLRLVYGYAALGVDVSAGPPDANGRYYRDEFSNGQSRCRDSETGQFADDSKCLNVDAGVWGETGAVLPAEPDHEVRIGIGGRVAKHSSLYAHLRYVFTAAPGFRLSVGIKGGPGFVQGLLTWAIPVDVEY